eukprot:NODE_378_length_9766_cov_0.333816.p3 type:complete len:778 gc:universal NODE_378_length_9766_cov_0.333816:5763-8096(+)
MQCFTRSTADESNLTQLYSSEYTNRQLFKTSTINIKVSYNHPEYIIYINDNKIAASQYLIYGDKLMYLDSLKNQIGIVEVKLATMRYISIDESIINFHIMSEYLVIVSNSNIWYGPTSLINTGTSNIQPFLRVLANVSGISCVCNNYICVASVQGITLYTINSKSFLVPLVGEKMDVVSNGDYVYVSGKMGYIYDTKLRYNAYTGPLPGRWVRSYINKSIYLVNEECSELVEKDIYSKIQQSIKMEMFELGIILIEQEPASNFGSFKNTVNVYDIRANDELESLRVYDKVELKSEVYKLFANYTYKTDSNRAMQYYIETIGYLEPSAVILKYMNSKKIEQLMDYLEALHFKNTANSDHTTLLLNCYSKSKSIARLDAFLKNVENVEFNPEVAIKVTREAGHYNQAMQLCRTFKNHHYYCKILLDDLNDYSGGLAYIKQLEFSEMLALIHYHGRALIDAIPYETTELFKHLCSEFKVPPEQFLPFYRQELKYLSEFLLFAVVNVGVVGKKIWTSLFEVALQNNQLTPLLLQILQDPNAQLDEVEVLLLCHTHKYHSGKLVMLQRMNLLKEIVLVYMDLMDHDKVLESAIEYCSDDKATWTNVLAWFAHWNNTDLIMKSIQQIEATNILTPVEVIRILAMESDLKMEIVKDYLQRQFKSSLNKIEEYQSVGESFEKEIKSMSIELDKIQNEPILFQETICSACQQILTLPIVHFYCHHSYHHSCLGDSEICLKCIDEYESPLEQENEKDFYEELELATDPFAKMTEYLTRHNISTTPMH